MLVSNLLKLKYPFFLILPIIMPMAYSIQETLKAGINRAIGTFIGALAGIALSMISVDNPLLAALGIILIIYVSNFIKWGSSAPIAGLVFISIFLGLKGENPLVYGINRVLATLTGILITIAVNKVLFNVDLVKEIEKKCFKIDQLIYIGMQGKILNNQYIDIEEITIEIEEAKGYLEICFDEIYVRNRSRAKIKHLSTIIHIYYNLLAHIKIINSIKSACMLDSSNAKKFSEIFSISYKGIDYEECEDSIVLNFHIRHALNLYDDISHHN